MNFIETNLKGCFIIEPKVFHDERGYFMESFNQQVFNKGIGQEVTFVQDNQSYSSRGVLRGLHYQCREHAQAKLVRVLEGEVLDVAVDLRPDSETYGQSYSILLSEENKKLFYIPRGFAHGFIVLSEKATFFYKCDNFYNKESEGGLIYNDPSLAIDWGIPENELIISEKDKVLPTIENARKVW
ncbi:dTDP-4-dehydrorhamnose 3,5-epimerase [Flavobacterium terrae]|uniref:dTDP-4-dehydrorhamnose 3,5-epimerase n=1 Tax=Flavobacterium terrae TaxID=415425 RepID=A0A1M6ASK4_9FLAO|nr:dTDP-4-dehydrorhamnose 3,5-epimerase [Flavobacterium terrae]SHI39499.1 dTDP-4-dehydrorhamnose 3,5-epimerase [Flavobacterium terrae]